MDKGWFVTPGRGGDRTLEQQMRGLEPLFSEVQGKTVLDVGCAEGLLSMECHRAGAAHVHGVEIVPGHVEVANRMNDSGHCSFEVADANDFVPRGQYDIVLLLAILHKLKNPTAAAARFADAARELVVLRMPPAHAPTIIDERSGNEPHHIGEVLQRRGFAFENVIHGTYGEWIGYYRRAA